MFGSPPPGGSKQMAWVSLVAIIRQLAYAPMSARTTQSTHRTTWSPVGGKGCDVDVVYSYAPMS
jgi:hypothetical protein